MTRKICIVLLYNILVLVSCNSNSAQPSDLESDGDVVAPIESHLQEETATILESEKLALPPTLMSPESALTPPVDIAEVQFAMAYLRTYLAFDKDGLAMPEISSQPLQ